MKTSRRTLLGIIASLPLIGRLPVVKAAAETRTLVRDEHGEHWFPTATAAWAAFGWALHGKHITIYGDEGFVAPDVQGASITCCFIDYRGPSAGPVLSFSTAALAAFAESPEVRAAARAHLAKPRP